VKVMELNSFLPRGLRSGSVILFYGDRWAPALIPGRSPFTIGMTSQGPMGVVYAVGDPRVALFDWDFPVVPESLR